MTRAYLRLDPAFDERKESYPDGPFAALIGCFCLAEAQPERGRFRSADYLRRLLGKRGKHVAYLVQHGDLIEQPGGRIYIDGWDEWQEGDWKVGERVDRIRNRNRARSCNGAGNARGNGDVTPDRLAERSGALHSGAEQPAVTPAPRFLKPPTDEQMILAARATLADKMASDSQKKVARDILENLGVAA